MCSSLLAGLMASLANWDVLQINLYLHIFSQAEKILKSFFVNREYFIFSGEMS